MAALKEILNWWPMVATIQITVAVDGHLNIMAFYKDSNARAQKFKPGTSMSVTIMTFKDHMFEFTFKFPSVTWYLKQAMGIASSSS
ncbi:hypothetical protein KPL71_008932 [Citrus sinensis]|uniref:Uncharacterized protein n=1 Tax=Citrus sinensis TaxID=2711 RepID=A0ACB8MA36_CITSI|nr:hypothetical protein KPL71_008932 [Citrus sinensis]